MVSTVVKPLLRKLFSDEDLRILKQFLAENVRPKLPAPIEKFIQQVESVLGKIETSGNASEPAAATDVKNVQEESAASTAGKRTQRSELKAVVGDYIKKHPGEEISVSSAAQEISGTHGLKHDFIPAGQDAVKKPVPAKAGTVQQTRGSKGATTLTRLPQDVGFSCVLKYSIFSLPQPQQERIVDYALKILGKRPADDTYSYRRLRSYEIFADLVCRDDKNKLFSALDRLDIDNTDAVFDLMSSFAGQQEKQPVEEKPKPVAIVTQKRQAAPASGIDLNRHMTRFQQQSVPDREPQTAKYCLSCLETAIQNLGQTEQNAVRSYAGRLLCDDGGQTGIQQKTNPEHIAKLGVFVDHFAVIVKSGSLPVEFYEMLAEIGVNDGSSLDEFNGQVCRAKNPYDILVVASEFAQSRYAQRVKRIEDLYSEDPSLIPVLKDRDGFHSETVRARNNIPALRAGQFYETIKKIPDGTGWGNRYNKLLAVVRDNPANAVRLIEWASSQQGALGAMFDIEMQKYTVRDKFCGVR